MVLLYNDKTVVDVPDCKMMRLRLIHPCPKIENWTICKFVSPSETGVDPTRTNTQTHTHTCSELALRILMWNASYVQKTLQLTWQERVDDTIRERLKSNPCLVTARSNWSIWTKSFSLYWQLRNTDCDNSALKRETLQKIDMPFLGLAGSQNCQSWSHSVVWQRKRNRQRINNAQLMNRNRRSTVLTIAGT